MDEEFTEFVHASWPGLYRTAYRRLGDPQLAEGTTSKLPDSLSFGKDEFMRCAGTPYES